MGMQHISLIAEASAATMGTCGVADVTMPVLTPYIHSIQMHPVLADRIENR
jgi:hypothetical protein